MYITYIEFSEGHDLEDFINDNDIKKSDIQAIIPLADEGFGMFYWE